MLILIVAAIIWSAQFLLPSLGHLASFYSVFLRSLSLPTLQGLHIANCFTHGTVSNCVLRLR